MDPSSLFQTIANLAQASPLGAGVILACFICVAGVYIYAKTNSKESNTKSDRDGISRGTAHTAGDIMRKHKSERSDSE